MTKQKTTGTFSLSLWWRRLVLLRTYSVIRIECLITCHLNIIKGEAGTGIIIESIDILSLITHLPEAQVSPLPIFPPVA